MSTLFPPSTGHGNHKKMLPLHHNNTQTTHHHHNITNTHHIPFDTSLIEQYPSRVINFSSFYDDQGHYTASESISWGPNCVLGPPTKYPYYGDDETTWCTSSETSTEFIEVEFPRPIHVQQGTFHFHTLPVSSHQFTFMKRLVQVPCFPSLHSYTHHPQPHPHPQTRMNG